MTLSLKLNSIIPDIILPRRTTQKGVSTPPIINYDRYARTHESIAKTAGEHINMTSDPNTKLFYAQEVSEEVVEGRARTLESLSATLVDLRWQERQPSKKAAEQLQIDKTFARTKQVAEDLGIEVSKTKLAVQQRKGKNVLPFSQGKIRFHDGHGGDGGYGVVRKAWFEPNKVSSACEPQYLAMKTGKMKEELRQDIRRWFTREAAIWQNLHHPNINELFDIFEAKLPEDTDKDKDDYSSIILLSPWADMAIDDKPVSTAAAFLLDGKYCDRTLVVLEGIINGLKYMHELPDPVYHGDLKGDNILLFGTPQNPIAKLTDFGLSKICTPIPNEATKVGSSVFWTAPEVVRDVEKAEKYQDLIKKDRFGTFFLCPVLTAQSDIWGLGMTIFQLITRGRPMRDRDFNGISVKDLYHMPNECIDEDIADYIDCVPEGLRPFLKHCLAVDASQRYSITALKELWVTLVAGPNGLASMSWREALATVSPTHSLYYPPMPSEAKADENKRDGAAAANDHDDHEEPEEPENPLITWKRWAQPRRATRKQRYSHPRLRLSSSVKF